MTEQYTLTELESNNPQDKLIFNKKGRTLQCHEYMESHSSSLEPSLQITTAIHNPNPSPLAAESSFLMAKQRMTFISANLRKLPEIYWCSSTYLGENSFVSCYREIPTILLENINCHFSHNFWQFTLF